MVFGESAVIARLYKYGFLERDGAKINHGEMGQVLRENGDTVVLDERLAESGNKVRHHSHGSAR